MSDSLDYSYDTKTILELKNLQENGHLNLEPGFQRKSVWTLSDRRKFIQSLLEGFPVPSIFLYKREENGMPIYDVLDGKQRLETIFMFSRVRPFLRKSFEVEHEFEEDGKIYSWDWRSLERWERVGRFLTFKIQVAEVSGELSDIIELFVRINSTGKPLTSSEKRHARFYTSRLLQEATILARRFRSYLLDQGIVSDTGIDRMKDVELVSELLASIINGGPIHKKQAVDRAVGNMGTHPQTLAKAVREFSVTLSAIKKVFPELYATRFSNRSEFYSLFMVIWEMQQQKMILTNKKCNQMAMKLLQSFSAGVDEVRERQKKAKGAMAQQRIFADYLLMAQQSTDALTQRKQRSTVIRGILSGLFERKDDQRIFSIEQRRLLWHSEDKKKCSLCGKSLDWTNFQVDHVAPHHHGGKTELKNAALVCASCNAAKGARKTKSKAR